MKVIALYEGRVTVGLTGEVREGEPHVLCNAFRPTVRQIIAVVTVHEAREGMAIVGRWSQLGVLQQAIQGLTPEGRIVSEGGCELRDVAADHSAHACLTLTPTAPLPTDSYLLQVFVDDKLARTLAFSIQAEPPAVSP
jgi:hypothetical protein